MEFFYHPWYMAAGGALISSPIIIHLINRMRFKRIRWAAMEFLLKSQKRNRRKLIIEQMILLLLRILLVLLAAFLVARFVYGSGTTRGASHLVVVDDTLSMNDMSKEGGKEAIAYETAIDQIKELAKSASEASSAQNIRIFLLSEIGGSPIYEGRLSDRSVDEIDARFTALQRKPTLMHVSPLVALQKGRQYLGDQEGAGHKVLHFYSDFRDRDWTTGTDADKLTEEIRSTLDAGISLNLVDVASPTRPQRKEVKTVSAHNNVAITDLKAETRVAIEDSEVEFTVALANFGTAKTGAFVEVFINNEPILASSRMLDDIEPGKTKEHKFPLRFARRARPGMEINERDNLEDRERKRRLEREQFNVRVTIRKEETGLNADNTRDLIIEVRKKVPTLVVDGNKPEHRGNEGSDMMLLRSFYEASGIYEVEERQLQDLEKADLDLYPSIMMLNVKEIPDPVIKRLQAYVNNGGSLCFFMGDEVSADHYNTKLFKAGLFPLLINARQYDPLAEAGIVDLEARKKERERLVQVSPTPKILFPKPDHVLVRRLSPFVSLFRYLGVNLYWRAQGRTTWDPDLKRSEVLVALPNTGNVKTYQLRAMELAQNAVSQTIKLADKEPEYKRFIEPVRGYEREIRKALASGELYKLGEALEDMLKNPGAKEKDKAVRPPMAELWGNADMKALKGELEEFRESVLYGDPLLVSRKTGKGRVVAYLTTAGVAPLRGVLGEDQVPWNNWGAGSKIQELYPIFLIDLHRTLISEGEAPNRLLGEDVQFTLDSKRYSPSYTYSHTRQPDIALGETADKMKPTPEKGVLEKKAGGVFDFSLTNIRQPGVYRVNLTLLGDGPEEDRQEVRAFAYNVDAASEGDLKRASRDRMVPELPPGDNTKRGKLSFRVVGDSVEEFKERQPDASESSLLYLFFILILVVEQAMAVHLSFHARANEQSGAVAATPASTPATAAAA